MAYDPSPSGRPSHGRFTCRGGSGVRVSPTCRLTIHSSRRRFAARLNSGVRHYGEIFMIWTIYAALLSLFFAFLTFRTIRLRQRYRVSLGHGKNLLLMRAIRVHGNFAEYVPLGLLLMAASE